MFKRIVVPLDGSDLAEKALACATEMADSSGAELTLLRVCDLPIGMIDYCGETYYEFQAASERNALEYLERIKENLDFNGEIHTKVLLGHPVERLLTTTADSDTDLVVMTSHGKSGIERWFLGSVAESFARRSQCPVLMLRSGRPAELPLGKNIVVPLDGSPMAEKILPFALGMAKRAEGKMLLLRSFAKATQPSYEFAGHDLYPNVKEAQKNAAGPAVCREYLAAQVAELSKDYYDARVSSEFSSMMAADAILKESDQPDVDLIAMTSHGATGPAKWVFGSVAEKVLRHANCPILLFKSEFSKNE